MYKTKDTKIKDLKAVEIRNQDLIVEKTGMKLDPVRVFEVIKKESDNFSKADVKVQEVDDLLFRLLNREDQIPVKTSGSSGKSQTTKKKELSVEEIQIQERERARKLKLLKLKLNLGLKTKSA